MIEVVQPSRLVHFTEEFVAQQVVYLLSPTYFIGLGPLYTGVRM